MRFPNLLVKNKPGHVEMPLKSIYQSISQAAKVIGHFANQDTAGLMGFNKDGSISSWNGKPLKLLEQCIYLGSNISSTERDANIHLGKA